MKKYKQQNVVVIQCNLFTMLRCYENAFCLYFVTPFLYKEWPNQCLTFWIAGFTRHHHTRKAANNQKHQ